MAPERIEEIVAEVSFTIKGRTFDHDVLHGDLLARQAIKIRSGEASDTSIIEADTLFSSTTFYEVHQVDYAGVPLNHRDRRCERTRYYNNSTQGVFNRIDDETKSGRLFHVKDSLQQGMSFEEKAAPWPEDPLSYQAMARRLRQVCATLPAPQKQYQLSRRLYPDEPLCTRQEWTKEVIDHLKDQEILKTS